MLFIALSLTVVIKSSGQKESKINPSDLVSTSWALSEAWRQSDEEGGYEIMQLEDFGGWNEFREVDFIDQKKLIATQFNGSLISGEWELKRNEGFYYKLDDEYSELAFVNASIKKISQEQFELEGDFCNDLCLFKLRYNRLPDRKKFSIGNQRNRIEFTVTNPADGASITASVSTTFKFIYQLSFELENGVVIHFDDGEGERSWKWEKAQTIFPLSSSIIESLGESTIKSVKFELRKANSNEGTLSEDAEMYDDFELGGDTIQKFNAYNPQEMDGPPYEFNYNEMYFIGDQVRYNGQLYESVAESENSVPGSAAWIRVGEAIDFTEKVDTASLIKSLLK